MFNSPINAIDPDGRDAIFRVTRNKKGEITGVTVSGTIYITGAGVPSDEQKMGYNNIVKRVIASVYILVALGAMITGCQSSRNDHSVKKKGFIIVGQPDSWYFVPASSIDSSDCFNDLASKQFGKGLQFNPSVMPNLSYVKRTFDTLVSAELAHPYIQVAAVEMEFTLRPDYLKLYESQSKHEKWNFKFSTHTQERRLEFIYNVFPISIDTVRPLFCLSRKASTITECPCPRDPSDPHDYLYKICNYVKIQDRYTDLPCKYRIKDVATDTLAGRVVTKVELTCCYLGDVAYFDAQTKEIISVSYGGK